MRKFILHTYDKSKSFDLNGTSALAAEPSGLGNAFSLSYKESEKGKHLVNVTPSFEPITLKIYFNADGTNGYANYKGLLQFLAECGTSAFLFEYNDGVTDKFCDVVLQSNTKSEISEEGLFVETFTFERQTYWYERVEESFSLKHTSEESTAFPLGFPFGFAGQVFVKRRLISNKFFIDAPAVINRYFQVKKSPRTFIAGQLSGVEGYVESIASGLVCGINAAAMVAGKPFPEFPETTVIGALASYLERENASFSP